MELLFPGDGLEQRVGTMSDVSEGGCGAIMGDDRTYRYRLWRTWDAQKPVLAWLMLNPSTADETEDDPTLRRCTDFAEAWGFGGVVVGNLFALRSPDPSRLREHPAPVGPENDRHLRAICEDAARVVAAWGTNGAYDGRGAAVARRLETDLYALDTTADGHPVHPLYQAADAELERWSP